jgi:hypothetical protein
MMTVDEEADQGVKKDNEGGAQSGDEEEQLLATRYALCGLAAGDPDGIQHEKGSKSKSRIQLCSTKMLQNIDDHSVSGISV